MIRIALAWILLFSLLFQVAVSVLAFKQIKIGVVQSQMSIKENIFAGHFNKIAGFDAHLSQIPEKYLNAIGYNNSFVYSDEELSFVLIKDAYKIDRSESRLLDLPESMQNPDQAVIAKLSLPDYVSSTDNFNLAPQHLTNAIVNVFANDQVNQSGHFSIDSPPPQLS